MGAADCRSPHYAIGLRPQLISAATIFAGLAAGKYRTFAAGTSFQRIDDDILAA